MIRQHNQPPIQLEITPAELQEWMRDRQDLVLLDIRRDDELALARLRDSRVRHVPLSEIVRLRQHALPGEMIDLNRPTVVFCHVGERSLHVVHWLRHHGWTQAYSLAGGIDAYARVLDPTIGQY